MIRYHVPIALFCAALGVLVVLTLAPPPGDAGAGPGVDQVVLTDHELAAPAELPDAPVNVLPEAPRHSPPSFTDRVRVAAFSALGGALGGIVVLGCGYLLELCCKRWGWLRRGWIGSTATTIYSVMIIAGGAVAVGGSWAGAWAVVGAAIVGGRLYARAPKGDAAKLPVAQVAKIRGQLAAHGLDIDEDGAVRPAAGSVRA